MTRVVILSEAKDLGGRALRGFPPPRSFGVFAPQDDKGGDRCYPTQMDLATHLELLRACRACPNVIGMPVTGAVENARVLLVGQAPGPHEAEFRRPFAYT